MSERDYETVEAKLRNGMVQGQMHLCLRDYGRLAGGLLAAGRLSRAETERLGQLAVTLSNNPRSGARKWEEAVEHGRGEPLDRAPAKSEGRALDWNSAIVIGERTAPTTARRLDVMAEEATEIIDQDSVESEVLPEPAADWQCRDIIRYLEAVFAPEDHVGIVADCWRNEKGKYLPKKGVFDRTAAQLCDLLRGAHPDHGQVIGDYPIDAGVWIRINALDGQGVSDENVTNLRHTLIEADDQDLGRQLALIHALKLPCTAIVHSGGKSIHAIVRVDAETREQYRARVDQLYAICQKNGLKVDKSNRNPARLSRLPGVMRGQKPQYLIATNAGLPDWDTWIKWTEEQNDDLPELVHLDDVFSRPANLAPELIEGILRVGHKMRITGSSKSGKSFGLIGLSVAIAEGREWLGFKCRQGSVLYVNLEISAESWYERIRAVYRSYGWPTSTLSAISVWSLRGKTRPLEAIIPGLIRRCRGRAFSAIIIDPIYKLNWGDENDAGDAAKFCNLLERICVELGVSIIDCHHHSKGSQGQKSAQDRGSGSGVFSRNPDAILDLIELPLTDKRREQVENYMVTEALEAFGRAEGLDLTQWPADARAPADAAILSFCHAFPEHGQAAAAHVLEARCRAADFSGWRVEATLREFAPMRQRNVWFSYPIHTVDRWDLLKDAKASGEEAPWVAEQRAKAEAKAERAQEIQESLERNIEAAGGPGMATIEKIEEMSGQSDDTIRRHLKSSRKFGYHKGTIILKKKNAKQDEIDEDDE